MNSPFSLNESNTLLVLHHSGNQYSTYAIDGGFITRQTNKAPLPQGVDLAQFDEVAIDDVKKCLAPHLNGFSVAWVDKLAQGVKRGLNGSNFVNKTPTDTSKFITS